MTLHATPIPAGWYPDPQGSFQQRWWDGSAWTNEFAQYRPTLNYAPQTKAAPAAAQIPVYAPAAPAPLSPPAPRADLLGAAPVQQPVVQQPDPVEPPKPVQVDLGPLQPTSPDNLLRVAPAGSTPPPEAAAAMPVAAHPVFDAVPSAAPAPAAPVATARHVLASPVDVEPVDSYQPFGYTARSIAPQAKSQPRRRYTVAAWLLAIVPALCAAAAVAIAYFAPLLYSLFAVGIVGLVLVVALIGLAYADSARLRYHGHEKTVPGIIGILGPVYFIARAVVIAKQSGRPAIWLLILSLLVWGGIAAAYVLVPGLAGLVTELAV